MADATSTPHSLAYHAENIWLQVQPRLPGFTVEVVPSIDSTNTELMRRARSGAMEPVLLVAETQTAGRGRLGKSWHSKPGQSLTFSLALPLKPASWSGLSLVVGLSVADSLGGNLQLKWPNDLWLEGRKLGGILVETAVPAASPSAGHGQDERVVVIGIGINIARPPIEAMPASPAGQLLPPVPPAGLAEAHMGITAGETLEKVVAPLVGDVLQFAESGFAVFAERFASRDALAGKTVQLSDGTQGVARGVDSEGALQVETPQGMRNVTSAEVSVRPC